MLAESADELPSYEAQVAGKCCHFNGLMNAACDAGVIYTDLMPRTTGFFDRLPCIAPEARLGARSRGRDDNIVSCSRLRRPTPDEVAARVAETNATFARIDALHERGLSHCCEAREDRRAVTPEDGGRVSCSKCGKRLYCEHASNPFY